jgi:hypothetical protein
MSLRGAVTALIGLFGWWPDRLEAGATRLQKGGQQVPALQGRFLCTTSSYVPLLSNVPRPAS